MNHQAVKCVIFDCEGTLVDSEKLCCQALVSVFNGYGAKLSMSEALNHFDGGKMSEILLQTRDRLGLKVDVDELEPLYREKVRVLYQDQLRPMAHAKEVLETLKQNGIEVCVLSNATTSRIQNKLCLAGLEEYFTGRMFSAFDANSWKPDPDLIQYAAMSMGFMAGECLFIDDTSKGVQAGVNAHIRTVHFKPNELSPEVYFEEVPQINDLRELLTMVGLKQPESRPRQTSLA
ncbi:putative phosphatase yieH [Vibrio ishigakensis]|uniref:Putative phosphatase yieH n=1 Tax=Vibrio ishigakensis TaxID=1481914 RepID=A0A0B8Q6Y0_9VIBR|nr:putative phosphatase yieH [Vibrio ishigakensis]